MDVADKNKTAIKGGEFLIKDVAPEDIFTPEEWSEEHKMILQTCRDFVQNEIIPNLDRIDKMEEGLMPSLLDKAGELGLLSITVPEDLGGLGLDFKSSMLAAEGLGGAHSFSVAYGAHSGIGTLPILYYGNEEQKKKYIPKLASGEWKASYCLTEPGSGSDANSGKTRAVLSEDKKHYVINGQKMWITNAGFANLFTVFAKIDNDENLSAFIVEATYDGISLNPEEKKMGIKGSSTRQVFFNDVKVPVENLLYERGKGFKIALNILNVGRIKLAGAVVGGMKDSVTDSIRYANERSQFGRQISKYGAIRYKLAEQALKTFAVESAVYRITQNIEDAIQALSKGGMPKGEATLKGIEEFAAECAMMKVSSSEALDYVVDEDVQIHGGMGFSAETRAERSYRDARINRIFEGTNEINRMLTVDMILKRALKGELDLMGPAQAVVKEMTSIPDMDSANGAPYSYEKKLVKNFKKTVLLVAGAAVQKLAQTMAKEQEVLMNIADLSILTYEAESLLLRVQKIEAVRGEKEAAIYRNMLSLFLYDSAYKMQKIGYDAINSFATGDEQRMMLMGVKRFTKAEPVNVKEMRQNIAQLLIEEEKYCF